MNAITLNFVGFCLVAILVLFCTIRIKQSIRKQLKIQGALLMSTVSSGVASVQAGIEEVKSEVATLKDTQVKTSAAIVAEIQRVEAVIVGLQGAPGDPAALQAAVADLTAISANLSSINDGLTSGAAQLDAEQSAAPTTAP